MTRPSKTGGKPDQVGVVYRGSDYPAGNCANQPFWWWTTNYGGRTFFSRVLEIVNFATLQLILVEITP
jgi:hypothetical protein